MKVIMNFDNIKFDGESINQKIDRELRKAEKREKKENGKRH